MELSKVKLGYVDINLKIWEYLGRKSKSSMQMILHCLNWVKAGYIKATEVRQMKVEMMVDTGAYMICINEELKNQLG